MAITPTSSAQQDFAELERERALGGGSQTPGYKAAMDTVLEKYGSMDRFARAMGVGVSAPVGQGNLRTAEPAARLPESPAPLRPQDMVPPPSGSPARGGAALREVSASRLPVTDLSLPPPAAEPRARTPVSAPPQATAPASEPRPQAAPTPPEDRSLPARIAAETRTKVTTLLQRGAIDAANRELGRRAQLMNPEDTRQILELIQGASQRPSEFPELFRGEQTVRRDLLPEAPPPTPQEQRAAAAEQQAVMQAQQASAPDWVGVEIPGHGVVSFPGTMTPQEIGIAIRESFPEFQQGLTSAVLNNLAQSVVNGFGLTFKSFAGLQTFIAQTEALNVDDRARLSAALEFVKAAEDPDQKQRMFHELRRRARRALGRAEYGQYLGNLHRVMGGQEALPLDISREVRLDPTIKTEERTAFRFAEHLRQGAEAAYPVTPENAENYIVQTTGAAGYSVPIILSSLINPSVGVATAMSLGSGEAVDRAVLDGAAENQIAIAGLMGTVPGAVDYLPVAHLFKWVRKAGGPRMAGFWAEMTKRAIQQGLIEGTTEGVQEFLQNGIAHMTYNPDHPLWEGVPDAVKVGHRRRRHVRAARRRLFRCRRDPPQGCRKTAALHC